MWDLHRWQLRGGVFFAIFTPAVVALRKFWPLPFGFELFLTYSVVFVFCVCVVWSIYMLIYFPVTFSLPDLSVSFLLCYACSCMYYLSYVFCLSLIFVFLLTPDSRYFTITIFIPVIVIPDNKHYTSHHLTPNHTPPLPFLPHLLFEYFVPQLSRQHFKCSYQRKLLSQIMLQKTFDKL